MLAILQYKMQNEQTNVDNNYGIDANNKWKFPALVLYLSSPIREFNTGKTHIFVIKTE